MVPAGNKAKRISSVNHTTKTIHHHHHHHNIAKENKTEIFPNIFYCCYLVVKTHSSIEFQNSIFYLFYFNNSHFIAVLKVIFLMRYPLEKHFKEEYISSVHYPGSTFSSNLASLKPLNFYSLS